MSGKAQNFFRLKSIFHYPECTEEEISSKMPKEVAELHPSFEAAEKFNHATYFDTQTPASLN